MKKFYWLICLYILSQNLLQAQSRKFTKTYTLAKQAFTAQNYSNALTLFEEVINMGEQNDWMPKAHYYYAYSAYKNKQSDEAMRAFGQVLNQYPNFEAREEVLYLMADIAFQTQKYEQALQYLSQIKGKDLQKDIKQMKGFYVVQNTIAQLRLLQQSFPNDTLLAQCLVDKIAAQSENYDELDIMDNLITTYQLEKPTKQRLQRKIYKRPIYKIAVMLPFDFDYLKTRPKDTSVLSRLSLTMYQGMRMAKKELDTLNGVKINLYAYDVKRDSDKKIDELIESKELDDIDFIISPLFDNLHRKIADFAFKQNINIINPVSFDSKMLVNKFTYLYEPSYETQAFKSIEYAQQNFKNKSVIIFYDNLSRNKNFAMLCKQSAEKLGLHVMSVEEISGSSLLKVNTILSKFNSTEVGSIFVISTSQLVASEMIKVIQNKLFDVPLFVPDAWLKFQEIDYADYERLNVHFIYPDYLNTETSEAIKFRKAYSDFARTEPENYSYVGYEIIHYFAKLLNEVGTKNDFRNTLKNKLPEQGKIEAPLDYRKANDNQFVPILKIKDGEPFLVTKIK